MNDVNFLELTPRGRLERLTGEPRAWLGLESTLAAATGVCGDHRFLAAATDPAVARGAIGKDEAKDLQRLIGRAQREALPLVLVIDSAGARVSEGVAIQGALRQLFADLLAARAAGLRTIAILGRNVFGGASMLAMLCDSRLYAERTRLAMTGPAVLQSRNGVHEQTVADTIAAANRLEHDRQGASFAGHKNAETPRLREMLRDALDRDQPDWESRLRTEGADLNTRLATGTAHNGIDGVQIVDPGILKLSGPRAAGASDVMQLVDALGTVSAQCDRIVLDCEWTSHSMRLADEQWLLSQYLAVLCSVVHAITARGAWVCLRIVGELSGGLYIALAGAASEVRLAASGRVLTLPPDVLDAFVKTPASPAPGADSLIENGVVDAIEQ